LPLNLPGSAYVMKKKIKTIIKSCNPILIHGSLLSLANFFFFLQTVGGKSLFSSNWTNGCLKLKYIKSTCTLHHIVTVLRRPEHGFSICSRHDSSVTIGANI
jgi:hypothetical protein